MRFFFVSSILVALLGACAVAPNRPTDVKRPPEVRLVDANLFDIEWTVFAIDGVPEVVSPKPRLRWINASSVVGTGGCNGFAGKVVSNLPSVRFGAIVATGKACLTLPGGQEDKFFRVLELTRTARLEDGRLVLLDDSGAVVARLLRAN